MKKKILSFMTLLILCLGLAVPAFAEETEGFANEYPRVIDNAELLSADERELLTSKLDEISTRQKVDVTVATTDTLDGLTVSDYAERFYESHNYGYGPDKDGTILLISMEDHDWYMATYGYAITAFTDAGIQYIGEEMTGDLSDGDFAAAFDTFADECDDFITQAKIRLRAPPRRGLRHEGRHPRAPRPHRRQRLRLRGRGRHPGPQVWPAHLPHRERARGPVPLPLYRVDQLPAQGAGQHPRHPHARPL